MLSFFDLTYGKVLFFCQKRSIFIEKDKNLSI